MAVGRMRRAPDTGVGNAVSSIIEHQKFKKMLIFGLRSLSDLCNPSLQLYVENALDALERNVVTGIMSAVENFGDDEDLVLCATSIMASMSQGCVEYKEDANVLKKMVNDGGVRTIEKVLERSPQDEDVLDNCFKFLENVSSLKGFTTSGAEFVPHLCKAMNNVKSFPVAKRLVVCLSNLCQGNEPCLEVKRVEGVQPLLDLCNKFAAPEKEDSLAMVESCFKVLKYMSNLKLVEESNLEGVITLIETCKDSKQVMTSASQVIQSVVDTAKLKNSLTVLEKNQPDTPEYKVAVNTLRCLSYISTMSDELAKGGVIPVLVNLVKNSSSKLSTNNAQIAEVVFGASRMLGSISASSTEYGKEVLANNGLEVLVKALSQSMEHSRSVCGISSALLQLLKYDPKSFGNAVAVALPTLYQLSEDQAVSSSLVEFLSASSQYSELETIFVQNKVLEILSTSCQYHTSNLLYQFNVLTILNKFSRFVENLSLVYEYGGIQGITLALSENYKDLKYCLEALNLVSVFAATSGSQQYLTSGDYLIADVILELMLHYRDNENVLDRSVKILDILLTEKDVEKYANRLIKTLPDSVNDPETTFKSLAALTGLHKILRLRPLLSKYNVLNEVINSVTEWLEVNKGGDWVKNRTNLTRAALSCVVVCDTNESIQNMLVTLSELACLPQVKKVIDLEPSDDNFLLHCTEALVKLCQVERTYDDDEMFQAVECINKVMKRHQDVRQAQASLLEALNSLMEVSDKAFLNAMLNTSSLVGVVNYLSTVPMYLNLQLLGIGLIYKCSQLDEQVLEVLRKSNCFQLLRSVNRTHTKSKKLRSMVGSLISLLMPADALETELEQLLKDLENYVTDKDYEGVHTCLVSLNQLLVSKDSVKVAVKLNVSGPLYNAFNWTLQNSKLFSSGTESLFESTLLEFALSGMNLLSNRMGLVYCTKCDLVSYFLKLYSASMNNEKGVFEEGLLLCLDGLVLLFKHDVANIDMALKHDLLATLSSSFNKVLNYPNVVSSMCKCLGALCASPGKLDKLLNNSDFAKFSNYLVANLDLSSGNDVKVVVTTLVALNELLSTKYNPLLEYFDKNTNLLPNLFNLLEEFYKNPEVVVMVCNLLSYFDKKVLQVRMKDLTKLLEVVSKALTNNKGDPEPVISVLTFLVQILDDSNKEVFKATSIVESISTVMLIHFENETITKLGGVLFTFLGAECQISAIMKNVINIVENKEENMGQKVDKLCMLLATYLSSQLKDRNEALSNTEPFLTSLNQCISFLADNSNLVTSTCSVSRKLCDSVFSNHEDPFGAWAVASTNNLSTIASLVKTEYGYSNPKFLVNAFRVFTACLYNQYTTEATLAESESLMVKTVQVLERYQETPELVVNVLEYLLYLANSTVPNAETQESQNSGVNIVLSNLGGAVQLVTNLMLVNKTNDNLVVLGLKLLTKLVSSTKNLDKKEVSNSVESCERLCKQKTSKGSKGTNEPTEDSVDRCSNYLKYFNAAFANGYLNEYMNGDRVASMMMLLEANGYENMNPVPYALFVFNSSVSDLLQVLEKMGGVRNLIDLFEKLSVNGKKLSKEELMDLFKGIRETMNRDPLKSVLVLKDLFPKLLKMNEELLTQDKEVVDLFLSSLVEGSQVKGVGRILHGVESLVNYLESVKKLSPELVEKLLALMKKDLPKKKSCQTVYETLEELLGTKEPTAEDYSKVNLQDVLLMEDFKFVSDTMLKYNSKVSKSGDSDCKDFRFGFNCVDVWSKLPQNCTVMSKSGLVALLISVLPKQVDLLLMDTLVPAMSSCCKSKEMLGAFVSNKELVSSLDQFLVKVYQKRLVSAGPGYENDEQINATYENLLINTMFLIDLTAVNRKVYLKSNVIPSLMEIWSNFDQGKYTSNKILRQVFRTLRKIVSEENVQLMMKCKLVTRVNKVFSELVETKDSKKGLLSAKQPTEAPTKNVKEALIPDALFLIGSMAIIMEIKEEICNVMLLEKIVDVLERYIKSGTSTAVVTNCCLALANICVDYKSASDKFVSLNGPQTNLEVFVNFKSNFEVINGASILLCNVLYKNERLKEIYGKNGTPAALVECLLNFVGSTQPTDMRCLESLFKAISNLVLYTKNIQYFTQSQVEKSFKNWLTKVTHTTNYDLPLMKVGLNSLVNLVVENNHENMKKLSVIIEDLVLALNLEISDPKIVFLILDALNNLCRLKENSSKFIELEGIYSTVKNMRRLNYDLEVLVTGLHLFGHMTTETGTVKLLEVDIFSLLLEILSQTNELNDVLISSFRCLRRLIQSQEMVYLLCSQDGLDTIIKCSSRMKDQSSVMVESIRLLLGMLYYTDPYSNSRQNKTMTDTKNPVKDDDSTGIGSDDDTDYGWENIGMNANSIVEVIKFSCYVASLESVLKMSRLQSSVISICTYFMSCGLCGEELSLNGFSGVLENFLTSFCHGNPTLTLLAVCVLESSFNYPPDLRSNILTKNVLKKLRDLSLTMQDKNLKNKCTKLLENFNSSESVPKEVQKFDLALSQWNMDPYPNGVHDLAENMKELLRTGGRFQLIKEAPDPAKKKLRRSKEFEHSWRASQDLVTLEWIHEPTQEKSKISFMRVRNIARGLKHELLVKANEKDYKKITHLNTLVLFGSPTEEYPQGFVLPMVFKTNKDRELVAEAFIQWRDASSYN